MVTTNTHAASPALDLHRTELGALYSRHTFLQCCQVGAEESLLLVPRTFELHRHLPVRVKIAFPHERHRFAIHGTVSHWVLDAPHPEHSGVVVSVTGSDQIALGAALAYARGLPAELGRRADWRAPVWVPIQCTTGGVVGPGFLTDLSLGGARLETWSESMHEGLNIGLHVLEPLNHALDLTGDVVSHGVSDGVPSYGICFENLDEDARTWLIDTLATSHPRENLI